MKLVLGWIVIALVAVFVLGNLESSKVWFFGIRAEMPIAFVVIASAILGAAATYTFTTLKSGKKTKAP
jgi:uncharacterized integral membrane protein